MGLRDRLMEAMGTLGLHGMKACFDEILAAGIKTRATPEKQNQELKTTAWGGSIFNADWQSCTDIHNMSCFAWYFVVLFLCGSCVVLS